MCCLDSSLHLGWPLSHYFNLLVVEDTVTNGMLYWGESDVQLWPLKKYGINIADGTIIWHHNSETIHLIHFKMVISNMQLICMVTNEYKGIAIQVNVISTASISVWFVTLARGKNGSSKQYSLCDVHIAIIQMGCKLTTKKAWEYS